MSKNRTTRIAATHTENPSPAPPPLTVSDQTIEELTGVFKMLADASRLKIMLALAQHGEMHVSALCELLDQSQPAVSHHLTLMRMTKLVGFDRQGKHNYYHLASENLRNLLEQFFNQAGNGSRSFHFDDVVLSFKRK